MIHETISIEQYFRDIIKSIEPLIGGKEIDITFKVGLNWEEFQSAQSVKPPAGLISYQGWAPIEESETGNANAFIDNYNMYLLLPIAKKDDTGELFRELRKALVTDEEGVRIAGENYNVAIGSGTPRNGDTNTLFELAVEVYNG
jgi:hypothetical protein